MQQELYKPKAIAMAEQLEEQSRALYQQARELRSIYKTSVTIHADDDGKVSVTGRVGGQIDSIYASLDIDAALDVVSHLLRGLEPPKRRMCSGKHAPKTPCQGDSGCATSSD